MIYVLWFNVIVLAGILLYSRYKELKSKKMTQYNSQVFHPQLTNIWKQAALDWVNDPDDERTFDTFMTDTIDLILRNANR